MTERIVYYETRSGKGIIAYIERGRKALGFNLNPVLVVRQTNRHKLSVFEKILESAGIRFSKSELATLEDGSKGAVAFRVDALAYAIRKKKLLNDLANPFLIKEADGAALVETLYPDVPVFPAIPMKPPEQPMEPAAPLQPTIETPHAAEPVEKQKRHAKERAQPYATPVQLPQQIQDDGLQKRRVFNYLEKRGVVGVLLENNSIYCNRHYHLKISKKDHGARGVDAARAIYSQLLKLGIERRNIEKIISQDYGKIVLNESGRQQLLEISRGYGW